MNRFKIELKSDLCVSNGESYGSVIDTDVAYDRYGLPVIKAKSLKGCLLEIAEELTELKVLDKDFIKNVFGKAGDSKEGNLILSDAHLENYKECVDDIISMNPVPSQNQVISCFSYTRGQTAIGENGTAKKESFRTIRVVNRGNTFVCEYNLDEKYIEGFKKCIKLLRRIGMNRTRGLGEVKCTPIASVDENVSYSYKEKIENCQALRYTIETISPLIATKGNEHINYIPGSTMEGLCFRKLGKDKMISYLEDGLRFTNGILGDGERRFSIAPGFIAKQKVPETGERGTRLYVFDTPECENVTKKTEEDKDKNATPPMPVKSMNLYISDDFKELVSISTGYEINYHHKQSEDNPGIIDGKNFYQISSLGECQFFTGYIYGTPEMLADIYKAFGDESQINIGYYRSAGYGKCRLKITPETEKTKEKNTDKIAVCLVSPSILYDNNGMPSSSPDVFLEYMSDILEEMQVSVKSVLYKYLRYTTLGGYNVTWNLNKQRFQAYDAGTCFVLELDRKTDIYKLSGKSIGERISDGFGEIKVYDYNDVVSGSGSLFMKLYENTESKTDEKPVSAKIKERTKIEELKNDAISYAESTAHNINATQIGRLLLMCEESENYKQFIGSIENIKDDKRRNDALEYIKGSSYNCNEQNPVYFKTYFRTMLTTVKYLQRKGNNNGESNS